MLSFKSFIAGLQVTTWWPCRWSRTKTFLTSRNWTKNHFHLNTSKVILLHWSPPWPPYHVVANQELPRLSVWPEDGMLTSDIPEVRNLSICELWLIHLILVSDEREPQINLHEAYKHVRTILFFIGYPRSRHSLLGSLLDAHPHIVVSDETMAFPRWRRNPKQWMNGSIYSFYDTLFRASKQSTMTGRRSRVFEGSVVNKDSNYGYSVPNQWQGNYDRYIQVGTFPAPKDIYVQIMQWLINGRRLAGPLAPQLLRSNWGPRVELRSKSKNLSVSFRFMSSQWISAIQY